MTEPIVTIAEIGRRARKAVQEGAGADSCPFNWHSAAFRTWNDEFRRAREEAAAHQFSRREP